MKCQRCKEREANVKIMKQSTGKAPQMIMLCDECARELGITLPGTLKGGLFGSMGSALDEGLAKLTNPLDMIASAFSAPFGLGLEGMLDDGQENVTCPTCGISQNQFAKTGFLGCPDCYKVFSMWIDPMFQRTQMGVKHLGRKPGNAGNIEPAAGKEEGDTTIKQVETVADTLVDLPKEEKEKRLKILEKEKLLEEAVKKEEYLEAAKIRDEIQKLKEEGGEK